jgi:SPP1 family predicted phage head-tail adaptor
MYAKSNQARRKCLKLYKSVRVAGAAGSATEKEEFIRDTWGEVIPLSGARLVYEQQSVEGVTHEVKTGMINPQPDNRHFFEFRDRRFTIEAVKNHNEDNYTLRFLCKERV